MTAAPVLSGESAQAALAWIGHHLHLPDGRAFGEAFPDDPWMRDQVLLPLLETDANGLPLYRLAWIGLHRGAAKTTLAAAVAVEEAVRFPATQVYVFACDADQARLLGDAIRAFCRANNQLSAAIVQNRDLFRVRNGSSIRIMASDVASSLGLGVAARRLRFVADELAAWRDRGLLDAALTALPKVANSQLIVLSNAGIAGSWQQEQLETFRAAGYVYDPPGLIASWVKREDVERLRQTMPESTFARFFDNVWAGPDSTFVELEQWAACADPALPPLDAATPVVAGVDAGYAHDAFAIAIVSRDPRRHDSVALRESRVWVPDKGLLDFSGPLGWLASFARSHNLVCCVFDAFQLHQPMLDFRRENNVWCVPFPQTAQRAEADVALLHLITQRRLIHDGTHAELRDHIANAKLQANAREDSRARLVKGSPSARIDAVVALSMACYQAMRLQLENAARRVPVDRDERLMTYSPEYRAKVLSGEAPHF